MSDLAVASRDHLHVCGKNYQSDEKVTIIQRTHCCINVRRETQRLLPKDRNKSARIQCDVGFVVSLLTLGGLALR